MCGFLWFYDGFTTANTKAYPFADVSVYRVDTLLFLVPVCSQSAKMGRCTWVKPAKHFPMTVKIQTYCKYLSETCSWLGKNWYILAPIPDSPVNIGRLRVYGPIIFFFWRLLIPDVMQNFWWDVQITA